MFSGFVPIYLQSRKIPTVLRCGVNLCVIATGLSAPVFAFDEDAATVILPPIEVRDSKISPLNLDQLTITGSRLAVPIRELPASVEAVDEMTMRERGDYEIKDAIMRATGLTAIGSGGNGGMAFSVRGFTGTNSVGIAEDGVRLSTGAGTQNYP